MEFTSQVQIVIEVKPLQVEFHFYNFDEDTPEVIETDQIQGYDIIFHDTNNLPPHITSWNYVNLTFTVEGKTCGWIDYTQEQQNKFATWTAKSNWLGIGFRLPDVAKINSFVRSKCPQVEFIDFETKGIFWRILGDYFTETYYNERELRAKVGAISESVKQENNTAPKPKGYDLGYSEKELETLHGKLIECRFIDPNTKLEYFKNAFNGKELAEGFIKLKWLKSYYASIFVWHLGHPKPWQIAVKVFDNGTIESLKNAYSPNNLLLSDNQRKAKISLDSILKSLR